MYNGFHVHYIILPRFIGTSFSCDGYNIGISHFTAHQLSEALSSRSDIDAG